MKNVFGYPEFDAEGEEILCTYDNAYSDMLMDIRVYRMEPGRKRGFAAGARRPQVASVRNRDLRLGGPDGDGQPQRRVH